MLPALKSIGLLGLLLAVSAGVAGSIAARTLGPQAYAASALAAGAVFATGAAAIVLILVPRTPAGRVNGALGAVLARTGLLLAALAVCSQRPHPMVDAGLVGLLLSHYLVALVAETLLCVRLLRSPPSAAASSPLAPLPQSV
ncbi:MAG: hypothetical protein KF688_03645 [Pirellulales bacterium]|nr:hypothetical protein [Pirellulales bacterium]